MSKRFLKPLAATLAAAGLFTITACGSSSGSGSSAAAGGGVPSYSGQPVTITFEEAMSSGAQQAALKKLVSDFHTANPSITVNLQEQPDYNTLDTQINAQVAAKSAPTIAQVYGNWADDLANAKVIVNLDNYAKASADYNGFYTGIKNDMKLSDGHTWMWPFNKSVVVQYYNKSMVPTAPRTWDEFADAAKKNSSGNVVALSIDPGTTTGPAGGTAMFEILAQANGDSVFADDGTPQFTKPGVVKAMDYLVDLKKSNALALGKNYPGQTALGNQTGAFDVSSVASYPFNLKAVGGKFELGVAGLPSGPSGVSNQLAGTNIALFNSASDDQKAAAWKFMQFLTSKDSMAYWCIQTGYLPVSAAVFDNADMKAYVDKNPFVKEAAGQIDNAKSLPSKGWINKASGALSVAIQDAVDGKKSSQEALQSAQDAALKAQKEGK